MKARTTASNAIEILETLASEGLDDQQVHFTLARSHAKRAAIEAHAGQIAVARSAYEQSLDRLTRLERTDDKNVSYRYARAVVLRDLGSLLCEHGDIGEARQALDDALRLLQQLGKADPGNALASGSWLQCIPTLVTSLSGSAIFAKDAWPSRPARA